MANVNSYSQYLENIAKQTKEVRITRFFPEADLRCMHLGLAAYAKKHGGLELELLRPGEFVVFSNKKQNKLKIYAPGNCIVYLKSPDDRRIDLDVIRYIPRFFNGTEFNYTAALQKVLTAKLEK